MPGAFTVEKSRDAVLELIKVPAHVNVAANMCRYDLMHGPAYARLPHGDVRNITDDDLATYYTDAEEMCVRDSDRIVEVYTSEVGDALRDFIDDLPTNLWYDDDCDEVMTSEPEGHEDDTGDVDDDGNPIMEWVEPNPYYVLERIDIIRVLFGRVIAREFS